MRRATATAASVLALAPLLGPSLAACAGPSPQAASQPTPQRTPGLTTTTVPATGQPYQWRAQQSAALDIGGGPTSTLSAVASPGANGGWLIVGSLSAPGRPKRAMTWESADGAHWAKKALPLPPGAISTAALAVTNWGSRRVIVGSASPDPTSTGQGGAASSSAAGGSGVAVWVSGGPGQPFSVVTVPQGASGPSPAPSSSGLNTGPNGGKSAGPNPSSLAPGTVMDTVTAGALGLFAGGSVDGRAAVWYSAAGQQWQDLPGADRALGHYSGAVINSLLSTPNGVIAAGMYTNGNRLSAAVWSSSDGIHWSGQTAPFAVAGDSEITALVDMSETGNSEPGVPGPAGLLAVGGVRVGATWQPSSWVSPNDGGSWSQTSESFPIDNEPVGTPGALVYAAAGSDGSLFAAGGSPGRLRIWESTDGLAWTSVPLPTAAASSPWGHLGLLAASGRTIVVADNIPGQPYVLVGPDSGIGSSRHAKAWQQPNDSGLFGRPLVTAAPTSLAAAGSRLVMAVQLSEPGLLLGQGSTGTEILSSATARSWSRLNISAFAGSTVNELLAVPSGLLAVGAGSSPSAGKPERPGKRAEPTGKGAGHPGKTGRPGKRAEPTGKGAGQPGKTGRPGKRAGAGGQGPSEPARPTNALARLSPNGGSTWPDGLISADGSHASPAQATTAGRVGSGEFIVGDLGAQAVDWFSPDGVTWETARPLDTSPQLAVERPLGSCSAGNSAVVVGSATGTARGATPEAWQSTDGSSWAPAAFVTPPPGGSFTQVDGCMSTGNGFIAFGGSTGDGQVEQPALWSSPDGLTWQDMDATFTPVTSAPPGAAGSGSGPSDGASAGSSLNVARSAGGAEGGTSSGPAATLGQGGSLTSIAIGTTTWLGLSGTSNLSWQVWPAPVGGQASAETVAPVVWSSDDAGNTWEQLPTGGPPFAATLYAQVDVATYVGRHPVLAGSVDGRLTVWVGTVAASPS